MAEEKAVECAGKDASKSKSGEKLFTRRDAKLIAAVAVLLGILVVLGLVFGGRVPAEVRNLADRDKATLRLVYGEVQLFELSPTDTESGKTLANEYCGVFYLKGRRNALGTRQSICLNVFYRFDPATKQTTEIQRREVRREWE